MSDSSKFYYSTGIKYNKVDQLNLFIENEARFSWIPNFHVCQNFNQTPFLDDFLKDVGNEFGGFLALYKIPAKCIYTWHTDYLFPWVINMVLDDFNSHTLFVQREENKWLLYVDELVYTPGEWVLFNSRETHSIINLDHRDRVLVSYRIRPGTLGYTHKNSTYQDVLDWFRNKYKLNVAT